MPPMKLSHFIEPVALAIDLVGAGIMLFGFGKSLWTYLKLEVQVAKSGGFFSQSKSLRQQLGVYLLLGFEFMIVSDVLKTMLEVEMELLIQLGLIVAIRTVIGFFLGQELKELD